MILGISGKANSGKSELSRIITTRFGAVEVSLADPIKRIARDLFGFTDLQLYGPSSCRNGEDLRLPRPDPEGGHLTPRHALQSLGSWGRDCYEHVWVDAALRLAAEHPLAIIPDVRYENELERIRRAGGRVIRIVRPGAGLGGAAGDHPSETAQDAIPDSAFDAVITNDGTLADLATWATAIVEAFGVQRAA